MNKKDTKKKKGTQYIMDTYTYYIVVYTYSEHCVDR